MDAYKKMINEILSNTSILRADIFDYEYSPFKDDFNAIFEFYHEALIRHSYYGIKPFLLFFKNDISINAAAGQMNGYNIVWINMGTIYGLINRFKEKKDLLMNCDVDDYIEFEKLLDVSINELMYQNALHFTFYHEMAHLIQKSDLLQNTLYERINNESEFLIKRHLLELDADHFSSLCIGTHTLQYVDNIFGAGLTFEQLQKTVTLVCSSALFYILSFNTNRIKIYYKEQTHPHPVIRITLIVLNIVSYLSQSLKQVGLNFEIDIKEMVFKCLGFSNSLSLKKFGENFIEDYQEIAGKEATNIIAYIRELGILETEDKTLASSKWNETVKRQKNK